MQLIAVDIGNSWTKLAVQQSPDEQGWSVEASFDNAIPFSGDALSAAKVSLDSAEAFWAVSSVNSVRAQQINAWLKEHRPQDHFHIISATDVAIESNVESRDAVGRDRLVAAAMALELNSNTGPVIVVDAGTAVTVDTVDQSGVFQGCLLYTSPSPRDATLSRMPSSA